MTYFFQTRITELRRRSDLYTQKRLNLRNITTSHDRVYIIIMPYGYRLKLGPSH